LKNRENYEIIDPVSVGVDESAIVLTARSGRAALKHHLDRLGHNVKGKDLDDIYEKFLVMADKQKQVTDQDVLALTGRGVRPDQPVKLKLLQVVAGQSTIPMATVHLEILGEAKAATSEGNGPIDACINAVKKLVDVKFILDEFLIQAITRGSDDVGKVHVRIKVHDRIWYGYGADTDIITASVLALADALSKTI